MQKEAACHLSATGPDRFTLPNRMPERMAMPGQSGCVVKFVAEYLEKAVDFERLATLEAEPQMKAALLKQGAAYRKLAAERAAKVGQPQNEGQ
jgi:hypothetical protein